jgi:uncharacterized protein
MKDCNQCGKCCVNYSGGGLGCATDDDLERWADEPDIWKYLGYVGSGIYDLWIDPEEGEEMDACPFLEKLNDNKYSCSIYELRPDACRGYPVSLEQMIRDKCEMLDD